MSGPHGSGSGGYFNPAMATGVASAALASGERSGRWVWVYWITGICGAILGGAVFALLHAHSEDPDDPVFAAQSQLQQQQAAIASTHAESDLEDAGMMLAQGRNHGFPNGSSDYTPPVPHQGMALGDGGHFVGGGVAARRVDHTRRPGIPDLVSEEESDRNYIYARGGTG